jgi:DNA-binding MurR/RpiR family transcriptional regulator
VAAQLQERWADLSASHRAIAERVMADPEGVAFMTVYDLAQAVDVNEATVVRFATSLRLKGFPGLKLLCRDRLREQAQLLRRFDSLEHSAGDGGLLERAVALDRANISRTFARLSPAGWEAAVRLLAEAPRVHVMGLRKCHAPAYLLGYLLGMVREDVATITIGAGTLTDDLRRVQAGDVFVAISVHRYSSDTVRAAAWAKERGARCVALTDNPSSPLVPFSDEVFYVDAAGVSVLRSVTGFISLVQFLAAGVVHARGHVTRETLLEDEELLERFDIYEAGKGGSGARRGRRNGR